MIYLALYLCHLLIGTPLVLNLLSSSVFCLYHRNVKERGIQVVDVKSVIESLQSDYVLVISHCSIFVFLIREKTVLKRAVKTVTQEYTKKKHPPLPSWNIQLSKTKVQKNSSTVISHCSIGSYFLGMLLSWNCSLCK